MKITDNNIKLIKGVEGYSIYLNDFRIVGNKPWAGGPIVHTWKLTDEDVKQIKKLLTNKS